MAALPLSSPFSPGHAQTPHPFNDEDEEEVTCQGFTWDLVKTLLNIDRREFPASPYADPQPTPLASRLTTSRWGDRSFGGTMATRWQDEGPTATATNDITINVVEFGGGELAVPLKPFLQGNRCLHVVVFDLIQACMEQEEAIREIQHTILSIESSLTVSTRFPETRSSKDKDIFLVGTFKDKLPSQDANKLLEDLSAAIVSALRSFESFSRISVPVDGPHIIFYALDQEKKPDGVSLDDGPPPEDVELSQLRHDLCGAIQQHEAIRQPRPAMWLRTLEELRGLPAPQREGESFYKHAVGLNQARYIADMMAYDFTNRPMDDSMFTLMLDYLEENGELQRIKQPISTPLPESSPLTDVTIIVQPEDILRIYKEVRET